jgi:hypothetical protein
LVVYGDFKQAITGFAQYAVLGALVVVLIKHGYLIRLIVGFLQ